MTNGHGERTIRLLSVVIPARDEEACIGATVLQVNAVLRTHAIQHEIIVVDDGSSDRTWELLQALQQQVPQLRPIRNPGLHGFGRAVAMGLDHMTGDAAVIMMADESDDCEDVVRYWRKLNEGYDCVFGSRFVKGGSVVGYPLFKLALNRMANTFLKILFGIKLNDTTNAFKAYRREVIEGCRPFIAQQFNLTIELPLRAIVRGYTWTVIPTIWRNRRSGLAKFRIQEMGSKYLSTSLSLWLEKRRLRSHYRMQKRASGFLPER